jgi:hypothetical protein
MLVDSVYHFNETVQHLGIGDCGDFIFHSGF